MTIHGANCEISANSGIVLAKADMLSSPTWSNRYERN